MSRWAGMLDSRDADADLVSAMLEPGFYPHAPSAVELRETHISWVFLAGDLAYKVKKPLVLPFLDYGTVERRREMCREEVRLNRRLAPRNYLRVVGVARGGDLSADRGGRSGSDRVRGRDATGGGGRRSLAALAGAGELEAAQGSATAALLAEFHLARRGSPERRRLAALEATLDENLATLRDVGTGVIERTGSTPPSASPARSSTPGETSSRRAGARGWCATATATCEPST